MSTYSVPVDIEEFGEMLCLLIPDNLQINTMHPFRSIKNHFPNWMKYLSKRYLGKFVPFSLFHNMTAKNFDDFEKFLYLVHLVRPNEMLIKCNSPSSKHANKILKKTKDDFSLIEPKINVIAYKTKFSVF